MNDSGYPDDIHRFDNDPRSPLYDDGGEENWKEERFNYLRKNPDCLDHLDYETLGEIVFNVFEIGDTYLPSDLHASVEGYIEDLIEKQIDNDWDMRDGEDYE